MDTKGNKQTDFSRRIAQGMLEMQRHTVLLYAQNDQAYKRFGNSEWSPAAICFGDSGHQGLSLRMANSNNCFQISEQGTPADTRLENRLASSDCNILIAMAANIAAIEYALDNISNEQDVNFFPTYDLPANRYEAVQQLKAAVELNQLSQCFKPLAKAIIEQHDSDGGLLPANSNIANRIEIVPFAPN